MMDASFVPLYLNEYDYYDKGCNVIKNIDGKTYADLSDEEKENCNMRGLCAYNLCNYLKSFL
jgi:hypothetical protein